jgi:hypothetical protein
VLFTGLNVFLALNRHSRSKPYSYHGELWADRGGYFVYLPAVFQFGFDAKSFPSGIDTLTGHGFKLDTLSNRVVTKYTSGVAMMQAPFYLVGHGIATLLGVPREPYGPLDHVIVDVAASCMLSLGLLLLFLVLRRRYGDKLSAWLLLGLYAGSNLFFYTIGDPGMSHVYSFFLFSALLYLLDGMPSRPMSIIHTLLIGLVAGWIILVRPTNVVFLLAAPFATAHSWRDGMDRLHAFIAPRNLIPLMCAAVLIWLPQLIYWHHAFGSAITWPYVDEGFTNWDAPRLAAFWFAPNNGLINYTPLYALALWAAFSVRKGEAATAGYVSIAAFLAISYLGGSWWVWHFGCGFGSRTMVEYLALFALPLAAWTHRVRTVWASWFPVVMFVGLAAYNLKLVYSYGNCWFHDEWDWQAFGQLVFGPTK